MLAYKITVSGIGYLTKLSFVRDDDMVVGYLHEYIGNSSKAIKTSALIEIDDEYTRIISDKRETEDLIINGYQEVYSTKTGCMLGAEVSETVKLTEFDTLWFNLADVSCFNNVKVTDEINRLNINTVYVNNSITPFMPKQFISRNFDIEMKDVFYIVSETIEGKTKYKKIAAKVPMLFVQLDNIDDLGKDIKSKNPAQFNSEPSVKSENVQAVTGLFDVLVEAFEDVKADNTYDSIYNYIN